MTLSILRRGGSPVSVRRGDSHLPVNAITRLDPWNDLAVMDRLFENFLSSSAAPFSHAFGPVSQPSEAPVELYETEDDLRAFIYAPGLASDSFDITAEAASITIKGARQPLLEVTEGMKSHTPWAGLATGAGTFQASYALPVEIDPAQVQANYKDGVLSLRLPKSEASKPRQVKVAVSGS